jgi:hypothetical protein
MKLVVLEILISVTALNPTINGSLCYIEVFCGVFDVEVDFPLAGEV